MTAPDAETFLLLNSDLISEFEYQCNSTEVRSALHV